MMKENEDGGVYPWSQWTAGGGLLCAAARGVVCGGVKEKKKRLEKERWESDSGSGRGCLIDC